jgi:hypothetical protein
MPAGNRHAIPLMAIGIAGVLLIAEQKMGPIGKLRTFVVRVEGSQFPSS